MIPPLLRRNVVAEFTQVDPAAGDIVRDSAVGGGCINETALVEFESGATAFVKWNSKDPPEMFLAEKDGLDVLGELSPLHVPRVYAVVVNQPAIPPYILMEDLTRPSGNRISGKTGFDEELGAGLATQHKAHVGSFYGFQRNNFIGPTPQPNPQVKSWVNFFAEHRLLYMIGLLEQSGKCETGERHLIEKLVSRLPDILAVGEAESPSLLHGDLWGGNVMTDGDGHPALIDPAVYWGHREADLAMTELFGGFVSRFRPAYEEVWPLEPGYCERREIYNLYHILNHAYIFGGGYIAQALAIARRFA